MKRAAACLAVLFVLLAGTYGAARDPRIVLFEKFNRATTYGEVMTLVSGRFGQQLARLSTGPKEQMLKALNSFQLISYDPRIVEINEKTSFLVLNNAKSNSFKDSRPTYLLSRSDGKNWTIASCCIEHEAVIKSLWTREYTPAEFNQPSKCSVYGKALDPSLNGKEWNLQSAVAFRQKGWIEIDLFPFQLTKADLDYWKFGSAMPVEVAAFQSSSVNNRHPECRIILGLGKNGQITFVNVGFNDPAVGYSTVFQGPGCAWGSPAFPPPSTQNGLPPEFQKVEITKNRIKLETAGELEGAVVMRWSAKINIPLLEKGL